MRLVIVCFRFFDDYSNIWTAGPSKLMGRLLPPLTFTTSHRAASDTDLTSCMCLLQYIRPSLYWLQVRDGHYSFANLTSTSAHVDVMLATGPISHWTFPTPSMHRRHRGYSGSRRCRIKVGYRRGRGVYVGAWSTAALGKITEVLFFRLILSTRGWSRV